MEHTLESVFWPRSNSFIKQASLVLLGVIVLAAASQLRIPLQPVPLTFQSATVILIGMAYGSRYSAAVIATYLLIGILGVPVFAGTSFFGPTGGYLMGFFPAAILSGYLAERGWSKNFITSFIAACFSASIIFLLGIIVLSQFVGWQKAITLGVMPFIFSETIKLLAVSMMVPKMWKKS